MPSRPRPWPRWRPKKPATAGASVAGFAGTEHPCPS
jgi:acyl transferase domain-containing protein